MPRTATPAIFSAGAVLTAGVLTLSLVEIGPLSESMAQHLAVMNVAAPLAAIALVRRLPPVTHRPLFLWAAAFSQVMLLWAWHAPAVQRAAAASPGLHLVMLGSLALAAVLFWALLLASSATSRWGGLAALLLTGKLACLLGALLIFAPRDLYSLPGVSFALCSIGPSTLADQQLAGLLMITACPLSYVVAGVVLAAQMMLDLERRSETPRENETLAAG
jgi:putative membrane protein